MDEDSKRAREIGSRYERRTENKEKRKLKSKLFIMTGVA